MRQAISPSDPLVLGLQNAQSGLFTDLTYSCAEWLRAPQGLFETHKFELTNACAIGTSEGPIVLATKRSHSLDPVCLLCGHGCRVTAITCGYDAEAFLSVDWDGNVAGWHLADGTCLFFYRRVAPAGDVRLCFCHRYPTHVFCWAPSVGVNLVDLETGCVHMRVRVVGLMCLGVCAVGEDVHVTGVNLTGVRRWRLGENYQLEELGCLGVDLDWRYSVTEVGLVRYRGNRFEIEDAGSGQVHVEMVINEIGEDDEISEVCLKNQRDLCFASYGGVFKVYVVEHGPGVKIDPSFVVSVPNCFVRSLFGYRSEYGVIAVKSMKEVICANACETVCLVMPQTARPCNVPDPTGSRVIQVVGDEEFEMYDWMNPEIPRVRFNIRQDRPNVRASFSVDFRSSHAWASGLVDLDEIREKYKICSITSALVKEPKEKLKIITGLTNGTVYFFWEEGGGPFAEEAVTNVPIIGLASLPCNYYGRPYLVAIGDNGSCVLLKWTKVMTVFLTSGFPIMSVSYVEKEGLVEVETSDGAFSYYSFTSSTCVSVKTKPVSDRVVVWRRFWKECHNAQFATNLFRVGSSCSYFGTLQILSLAKNVVGNTRQFLRELMRPISRQRMTATQTEFHSFVLLGAEKIATLFFPFYKITGTAILETSPYTATLHFLAYQFIASILQEDIQSFLKAANSKIGSFLPILTQFLITEYPELRRRVTGQCIEALKYVTLEECQLIVGNYIEMTSQCLSEPSLFLFAIVFVSHNECVRYEYKERLFEFLCEESKKLDVTRNLAIVLLLEGFEAWCKVSARDKPTLFSLILESFLSGPPVNMVEDVLVKTASQEIEPYFEAVTRMIADARFDKLRICQLCSRISLDNGGIGSTGTFCMALTAENNAQMAKLVNEELEKHAQILPNVAKQKKLLLIGRRDGYLAIFKKMKMVFLDKLFQKKIDIVSIGPNEKCAAIVSFRERSMKKFSISGMFKTTLKDIVVTQLDGSCDNLTIIWTSDEECKLQTS